MLGLHATNAGVRKL